MGPWAAFASWKLGVPTLLTLLEAAPVGVPVGLLVADTPTDADLAGFAPWAREALAAPPGDERRLESADGRVVLRFVPEPFEARSRLERHRFQVLAPDAVPADARVLRHWARLSRPDAVLRLAPGDSALERALTSAGFAREPDGTARWRPRFAPRGRSARPSPSGARQAVVVGAGLAGAALAARLARSGWAVTVLDARSVAAGASGNPAGVFHPHLSLDDCPLSRLSRHALRVAFAEWQRIGALDDALVTPCGSLELAEDPEEARRFARLQTAGRTAGGRPLDVAAAARACGLALSPATVQAAWLHEAAGWARPDALCARWLETPGIVLRTGAEVTSIDAEPTGWTLRDARRLVLAQAPVVVLAAGAALPRLLQGAFGRTLPLATARGQLGLLPAACGTRLPVTGAGYLLPAHAGQAVVGATYEDRPPGEATEPDAAAHAANLQRLARLLAPAAADAWLALAHGATSARVAWRATAPDRLPLAGPLPGGDAQSTDLPLHERPVHPGLWVAGGLGSRGLLWAPLVAELLAAALEDRLPPLPAALQDALDPARFSPAVRT